MNISITVFTNPNPITKHSSLEFLKKSELYFLLYDGTL